MFTLRDSAGFSSTPFTVVKVPFCMKVHVSCLISVKLPSKQSLILYTKLRKLEPVHILLQLVLCFLFDIFFFNLRVYHEIEFIYKLKMQFLPQSTSTFAAVLKEISQSFPFIALCLISLNGVRAHELDPSD